LSLICFLKFMRSESASSSLKLAILVP
jgi:hypothetical protein